MRMVTGEELLLKSLAHSFTQSQLITSSSFIFHLAKLRFLRQNTHFYDKYHDEIRCLELSRLKFQFN